MEKEDSGAKLGAILNLLSGSQEDKLLKSRVSEKLAKDKQNEERNNRYKQKERLYQATPIVIDGLTMDGQKSIVKAIKAAVNLEVDAKKPEVRFPWLKMILGLLAFAAGLILGFLTGAIQKLSEWGRLIKGKFASITEKWTGLLDKIKKTNVWKFLSEALDNLKGKFNDLVKRIKNSKVGMFVTEIFDNLRSKFTETIQKIKNSKVVTFIEDVFTQLRSKFDDIIKGIKNFATENIVVKTVYKFFKTIDDFFKPLTDLLPKSGPSGGFGKFLKPIFEFFDDIWKSLSGFFKAGFNVGKQLGKALGPLFLIVETLIGLYQSFTDPKLKDKSFLQKALTGVVTGIIEFFTGIFQLVGLDLFDFKEIRDRIDKIFESFKEGFVPGILQLFNQLLSSIYSVPIKIVGWIVGWFDKDAGDKIKDYGKQFDYFKFVKDIMDSIVAWIGTAVNWIVDAFKNLPTTVGNLKDKALEKIITIKDAIFEALTKVVDWLKSMFTWDNLKKLMLNATPLGLAIQGGKWLGEKIVGKEEDSKQAETGKPTPVGDLIDDNQRVMYSKRGSYSFDKNDQIVAMKKGGPIENALKTFDNQTSESVNKSNKMLELLTKRIDSHFSKTEKFYESEFKLLTSNNQALLELKDKEQPQSNVVVNNSTNSMVLSQKTASNNEYRFDLAGKVFAY